MGASNGFTSPDENRFAGDMIGDCSAEEGMGGVDAL